MKFCTVPLPSGTSCLRLIHRHPLRHRPDRSKSPDDTLIANFTDNPAMTPHPASVSTLLAIDSHVHFHDMTDPAGLFDACLKAFRDALPHMLKARAFSGMLVLTEPQSRQSFASLLALIPQVCSAVALASWTLERTGEDISLRAVHRSGETIFLLAGQQIVTAENLEVLSLLALPFIPDGLDLRETVRQVRLAGGLPVLPWGVGKWLGRRGKIISEFLQEPLEQPVFLGDNGGRPALWASVPQFRLAADRGVPVLRGSDPLRCSFTRRQAGSFGNLLEAPVDPQRPADSLRRALTTIDGLPAAFGRPERLLHFCKDQLALRTS